MFLNFHFLKNLLHQNNQFPRNKMPHPLIKAFIKSLIDLLLIYYFYYILFQINRRSKAARNVQNATQESTYVLINIFSCKKKILRPSFNYTLNQKTTQKVEKEDKVFVIDCYIVLFLLSIFICLSLLCIHL